MTGALPLSKRLQQKRPCETFNLPLLCQENCPKWQWGHLSTTKYHPATAVIELWWSHRPTIIFPMGQVVIIPRRGLVPQRKNFLDQNSFLLGWLLELRDFFFTWGQTCKCSRSYQSHLYAKQPKTT